MSSQLLQPPERDLIIVGAGPAGLTAACEAIQLGFHVTVLEKDCSVGGIARTELYNGYRFDIGGHRFFTKVPEVKRFWADMMGAEFLTRSRISRIFYNGKFFDYPLKAMNALTNLGLLTSITVVLSYIRSRVFPYHREDTFEEWVSNRFGKVLYHIFFKTYTEKVWGIPCSEIRAEWAAQRIKGLSLPTAIWSAIFGSRSKDKVTTLIEEFQYPHYGPGQMWQSAQAFVIEHGGQVELNAKVIRLKHDGHRVASIVIEQNQDEREVTGTDFISSMPISELILKLDPPAPADLQAAAKGLTYRDFITVVLIVDRPSLFPDNWIYIHSPQVKIGRIQNFKNWSPDMVPDPTKTALGLEYFCTEGDDLWRMSVADLLALGKEEIEQIGLARSNDIIDGTVVRQLKAYPVYNSTYGEYLAQIKDYLARFENLQTVGRNGLHKYNNQDHSMLTAMLAVRNLLGGQHDVWEVNTERSYHEEMRVSE